MSSFFIRYDNKPCCRSCGSLTHDYCDRKGNFQYKPMPKPIEKPPLEDNHYDISWEYRPYSENSLVFKVTVYLLTKIRNCSITQKKEFTILTQGKLYIGNTIEAFSKEGDKMTLDLTSDDVNNLIKQNNHLPINIGLKNDINKGNYLAVVKNNSF